MNQSMGIKSFARNMLEITVQCDWLVGYMGSGK